MHNERKIGNELFYVGGNDRRIALFENVYPVPDGVTYNSYIIKDEKTALLDTVDSAIADRFLENVSSVLNGKKLDYIIVNHMEPDHAATLTRVIEKYPEATVVGNTKTLAFIKQFFDIDIDEHFFTVKEGDELSLGKHILTFVMAPLVHWPEVMVTYDKTDKVLFSADAFGTFGTLSGNLFSDEYEFGAKEKAEARRYYTNIVGKYGAQVSALLTKASKLDIDMICPLHGPVWRNNISEIVDLYKKWAAYEPEEKGVLIVYGSIYGNTENAAEIIAGKLADSGVKKIAVYDASKTDASYIVAEAFKYSHIIIACATYNNEPFTKVETLITELKEHNLSKRTVALVENGTWGPQANKKIAEVFSAMKDMTILESKVTVKSSLKQEQLAQIDALVAEVKASL